MSEKSLVKKITSGSITLIVCAFVIALGANYWHARALTHAAYKKQLSEQLALLSQSLEGPLWSLDDDTVKLMGDAYMAGTDPVSLEIYAQHRAEALYSKEKSTKAKVIYGQQDVFHDDLVIGRIRIGLSGAAYSDALARLLVYSLLLGSFIILSLTLLMKELFRKHLKAPLESLEAWTDSVATGDFDIPSPTIKLKELSSLAQKFANMSDKIQRREHSLQASEKKFRGLFENTEVSIWNEDASGVFAKLESLRRQGVTDLRQHLEENPQLVRDLIAGVKVVQVNEATLTLFNAATQEDMLARIDRTFGPDTIKVFIDELCAIWDRKQRFRAEASFRTLDGKELSTIISFHIPETAEGFKSFPVTIIDITERKQAEQELAKYREHLEYLVQEQTLKLKKAQSELLQRERLTTLGKLTATVSHELRNPLGTIQAALCTIEDCLKRDEPLHAVRSLALAERSINRCTRIIEELNDYARIKRLDYAESSVDGWVQSVFDDQAIPDGIKCELDLSSGVRAEFDKEKMRQAVINLLSNAVHALLEYEGVEEKLLHVSTLGFDSEYEIRIRDNGVGMTDETADRVFEPLYSTKGFGVGLGMVIVKNIVEQHHGKISIQSEKGRGTLVALRLPINKPRE